MKRGKERTYVKIPENYLEKVYAGWLGKVIGIRLGAAIEGWSYQRIQNVFGTIQPSIRISLPMTTATALCSLYGPWKIARI